MTAVSILIYPCPHIHSDDCITSPPHGLSRRFLFYPPPPTPLPASAPRYWFAISQRATLVRPKKEIICMSGPRISSKLIRRKSIPCLCPFVLALVSHNESLLPEFQCLSDGPPSARCWMLLFAVCQVILGLSPTPPPPWTPLKLDLLLLSTDVF